MELPELDTGHLTYHPYGDYVAILPIEPVTKSAGGIFIPDSAKRRLTEGEVIAVGPKVSEKGPKVGHRVIFSKNAGWEIPIQGTSLLVLNEGSLMGYVTYDKDEDPLASSD